MGFKFHKEAVEHLAKLLKETDLKKIKYEHDGVCINLEQGGSEICPPQHPIVQNVSTMPLNSVNTGDVVKSEEKNDSTKEIKSPILGTVYVAPKPGADPFVSKGSKIKEGDVLFIVEAMKVMNEVKSPFSGTIEEILIKDGSPVEFDQILAKVS